MNVVGLCLCLAACGAGSSSSGGGNADVPRLGAGGSTGGVSAAAGSSGLPGPVVNADAGAAALPPEQETQVGFQTPRAGARFVFVSNPQTDNVAVIDSTTLVIRTVVVGDHPTEVAVVPNQDVAVVLNAGSQDATVVRATALTTSTTTVPLVAGVNALAMSPDGHHLVAWSDSSGSNNPLAGASGSFQDVSLITLGDGGASPDTAWPLTVGFRPSSVVFSADGAAAFVVSLDGVSVIRFADVKGPQLVPLVPLVQNAVGVASDVSVSADGKWALARQPGSSTIDLVDLTTRAATHLDLQSEVTDLDLSPTGDFALAVLRDQNTAVKISLPAGFSDPAARRDFAFPDETIGSATITPNGATALLYTTTAEVPRVIIADLTGTTAPVPFLLRKGVRGVAVSPDSKAALVLHTKAPGDPTLAGISIDESLARSYGYSIVDLTSGFAKLQTTAADPGDLAITPDSQFAFVLLRDDKQGLRVAQRLSFQSFNVTDFLLGSPPLSVAALTGSQRVFVNQLHPEGRISFIDWLTGDIQSVTGFELNGGIVQ